VRLTFFPTLVADANPLICLVPSSATRKPSCQPLDPGWRFSTTTGLSVSGVVNVAVTVVPAVSVTTHEPLPLQPPPLQPAKVAPLAGVAVSVTVAPVAYGSVQSVPQLMPAGTLVTVPAPAPVRLTVSVNVGVLWTVSVAALSTQT